MAYFCGAAENVEAILSIVKVFFAANTAQGWVLRGEAAGTQSQFTVENKNVGIALGFNFGTGSYDAQLAVGTSYTGGAWPGIQDAHSTSTGSPFPTQVPAQVHLIMTKDHFFVVLVRLSDYKCFTRGGGVGTDTDPDVPDAKCIWGSGPAEHHNNWPIPFLCQNFASVSTFVRSSDGRWYSFGDYRLERHVPYCVDSSQDSSGTYDYRMLSDINFPLSGTTVFLPALLTTKADIGGQVPRWDLHSIRCCSVQLTGSGDVIEYQGKPWIIFNNLPWNFNPTDGRKYLGFAFELDVGDA